MEEKRNQILIIRFLIALAVCFCYNQTAKAQKFSFDNFKTKRVRGVNKKLVKVLKTDNETKIVNYLTKNPKVINDGVTLLRQSKYMKFKTLSQPVLWALTEKYFNNNFSLEALEKVLALKPNLQLDYKGKNYFYYLLDELATTKIEKSAKIERIFFTLIGSGYNTNRNYQSLPPPLTHLLYENYQFLNGNITDEYLSDDVLILLIKKGANINAVDKFGNNLISFANKANRQKLIDYLLANNIDVNSKNKDGEDAFIIAIKNNNLPSVKKMIDNSYRFNLYYGYKKNIRRFINKNTSLKAYLFDLAHNKKLNLRESLGYLGIFPEKGNKWFNKYERKEVTIRKNDYPKLVGFINKGVTIDAENFHKLKVDYLQLSDNVDELFINAKKITFSLEFKFVNNYWKSENGIDQIKKNIISNTIFNKSYTNYLIENVDLKTNNYFNDVLSSGKNYAIFDLNNTFPSKKSRIQKVLLNNLNGFESILKGYVKYSRWDPIYSYRKHVQNFNRYRNLLTRYINTYGENKKFTELINVANERIADFNSQIAFYEAQERAQERKLTSEDCVKCRLDKSKTSFPTKEREWIWTVEKPGKIVMQNGSSYEFYYENGKYTLKDSFLFFSSTKFDTFDKMLEHFLDGCKQQFCY